MAKHAGGRPKGSKTSFKGSRNKAFAKREKKAEFISAESLKTYNDPKSSPEVKAEAWQTHLAMEKRLTKIAVERQKQKARDQRKTIAALKFDPTGAEPECLKTCGVISCAPGCPRDDWDTRRHAYYEANPESKPKPEPKSAPVVIAEPTFIMEEAEEIEPAPVVRTPRPIVKPAPVIRKAKEGHSGKFFNEVFWDLPIFERNMILMTLKPDQQAEWQTILENTTLPPPQPVRVTLTEAEKRQAFSSPSVLPKDEAFATGVPLTVDQVRETYAPTMGNATPDSGLSVELDRRQWLPNVNPLTRS